MSTLTITDLRCEYRTNPIGIDAERPRLSWRLETGRRGARQSAYRVRAAASLADLETGQLIWDSGRIESNQSLHVAYGGPALRSAQQIWWQVHVWDDLAAEAASAPALWEMGLLARSDWSAQWIAAPFVGGERTSSPAPFLRTTFVLDRPIAAARLYATALGLYECFLNGKRVGNDALTPGWTDYRKRVLYHTYDVTALLTGGENALGAILGDGWYCGFVAWRGRQLYGDRPKLLAQLVITFTDGTTTLIGSGPDWKVCSGPILESDLLMGESYDARLELPGWNQAGYDDTRWLPALIADDPGALLVAAPGPAVRPQEVLRPVAEPVQSRNRRDGVWIFDMGQNMVGRVRLRVQGDAGTTVTLRYAEVLNADGTLYTTNLRGAKQIDHYTLRGGGEEIYEPHFTFHGFRYVELSNFPGIPTVETLAGIVLNSDMTQTGDFECSEPLINQLQHNIRWGQKGNFVDVPTDCPQRDERLGWTGDAQVFIRTAAFNMDVAGFFTRWMRDLEDAQTPQGAYPSVVPVVDGLKADGGPAWADAGVICPWTLYLAYGDRQVLEEHYASMRRFVDYLEASSIGLVRSHPEYQGWRGYGDWLALDGSGKTDGGTPKDLIGTAFFAYSTRLLARIAETLGNEQDTVHYERLFERVRQVFQARFVTPEGLIVGQTQTCYVLALAFDLLPAHLRPVAVGELVRDIQQRGMHLSTGFVSTNFLPFVLSDAGRLDVAYNLLMQTSWPSWLYPVTQGATTIWERWDGWTPEKGFQDPGMNSFNHYAYGAIGAWLYGVVAGIETDPAQPGYKHTILRPHPGGGLTHARATHASLYGTVASGWRLEGDLLHWEVTVPPNTSATLYLPAPEDARVQEGGRPLEQAEGVAIVGREGETLVLRVGAGTYRLSVQ